MLARSKPPAPASCARPAHRDPSSWPNASAANNVSPAVQRSVLQPGFLEAGWDSLWTPVFDPFSGYCDQECNLCGQICPSGAIPALELAEKNKAVIGTAFVHFATCVRCMDCLEYCPYDCFEEFEAEGLRGVFPQANPENCIGCGLCVEVCPKKDELAIAVYPCGRCSGRRIRHQTSNLKQG
jgi:formate hydrogenlyase subunit 6/NADH:ubiquinone oxidoreductase subunit I